MIAGASVRMLSSYCPIYWNEKNYHNIITRQITITTIEVKIINKNLNDKNLLVDLIQICDLKGEAKLLIIYVYLPHTSPLTIIHLAK